jgi:uncharacterized membrane protein
MSQTIDSTKPAGRGRTVRLLLTAGISVAATLVLARIDPRRLVQVVSRLDWRPHAPDLGPVLEAPAAIQVHVAVVLAALLTGLHLLLGPKGRVAHRVLGWTWAAFMMTAAVSSFFIHMSGTGSFNLLHVFSLSTLIAVPLGVHYARRHNVRAHSGTMTGLFNGGLLVAGAFAFLPGRLMWRVFFG